MTPAEVSDALTALRRFLAEAEQALPVAAEIQWERSPGSPRARDDEGGRVAGPISDPTFEIVADERRLALRAEVKRYEAFLSRASGVAAHLSGRLPSALDAWEGAEH